METGEFPPISTFFVHPVPPITTERGIFISVDEKGYDKATGKVLIEVDPKYFRPCEVDTLLGDPTKAKTKLGWNPRKTSFEQLVKIMMKHDLEFVVKDANARLH